MKHVATYLHPRDLTLAEGAFRESGIHYSVEKGDEDTGSTDLYVSPEDYERACNVAEQLDEFLAERRWNENKNKRECLNCGSTDLQPLSDIDYDGSATRLAMVFKCNQCGHANPDSYVTPD